MASVGRRPGAPCWVCEQMNTSERRQHRRWALVVIGLLQLLLIDVSRVPYTEHYMGVVMYGLACVLFQIAAVVGSRFWIRSAVSWAISVGLLRSALYFWDDGRLPPLGFNASIALLMYLNYTTEIRRTKR